MVFFRSLAWNWQIRGRLQAASRSEDDGKIEAHDPSSIRTGSFRLRLQTRTGSAECLWAFSPLDEDL
jgi:hypothetical protein